MPTYTPDNYLPSSNNALTLDTFRYCLLQKIILLFIRKKESC